MTLLPKALAVLTLFGLVAPAAHAADDVLFVITGDLFAPHNEPIGRAIASAVRNVAEADGGAVDVVVLYPGDDLGNLGEYEQVWLYDLSTSPLDSNNALAYGQIAAWWEARPTASVIFDGRIIGDTMSGTETALFGNYYRNLEGAGGGLVLGTDDGTFHAGINDLAEMLEFDGFGTAVRASVAFTMPVDSNAPIMSDPNAISYVKTTTGAIGRAPSGLQPNGLTLSEAAWFPGHMDEDEAVVSYHIVEYVCSPETCYTDDACSVAECTEDGTCEVTPRDDDGDGVEDCEDGCPNDPDKVGPGVCGCDVPDDDWDGDGVEDCVDNCPDDFNPHQDDGDGDGTGDACDEPSDGDGDGDGVRDDLDLCPDTEDGAIVDLDGCSLDDQCPCDGDWRNHAHYFGCVARTVRDFVDAGSMSHREAWRTLGESAGNSCGYHGNGRPWDNHDHKGGEPEDDDDHGGCGGHDHHRAKPTTTARPVIGDEPFVISLEAPSVTR